MNTLLLLIQMVPYYVCTFLLCIVRASLSKCRYTRASLYALMLGSNSPVHSFQNLGQLCNAQLSTVLGHLFREPVMQSWLSGPWRVPHEIPASACLVQVLNCSDTSATTRRHTQQHKHRDRTHKDIFYRRKEETHPHIHTHMRTHFTNI